MTPLACYLWDRHFPQCQFMLFSPPRLSRKNFSTNFFLLKSSWDKCSASGILLRDVQGRPPVLENHGKPRDERMSYMYPSEAQCYHGRCHRSLQYGTTTLLANSFNPILNSIPSSLLDVGQSLFIGHALYTATALWHQNLPNLQVPPWSASSPFSPRT